MEEIEEAVEEAKFREDAFESIRRRHHHDDGTEIILNRVEHEGIERKLIEEENLWRLRNQQPETRDLFENPGMPAQEKPADQSGLSQEPKKKQVTAGCNCGKMFEVSDDDDSVRITLFDSSGKVENSYLSSGSSGSSGYGSLKDSEGGGYSSSGGAPKSSEGYS